jgi:exodeoxyribonuclease VII large subunit
MNPLQPLPKTIFSLQSITRRLKEVLAEVESKRFWVQAQFVPENGGKRQAGHCYGSLVEHDDQGRTIARMRVVIWNSYRERIEQKLREAGCERLLAEEQEICALSAVMFHPVYGLSLEICDVDPTLGFRCWRKTATRSWSGFGRRALWIGIKA